MTAVNAPHLSSTHVLFDMGRSTLIAMSIALVMTCESFSVTFQNYACKIGPKPEKCLFI